MPFAFPYSSNIGTYSQPVHHGRTKRADWKVAVDRLLRVPRSEGSEDSRSRRRLEAEDAKEGGIGCDVRHSRPEAVRILHAAAEAAGSCRSRLVEEEDRHNRPEQASRTAAGEDSRHDLHSRPEEHRILAGEDQRCILPVHRYRRRYSWVGEDSCCRIRSRHRRHGGPRRYSLGQGIRTWLRSIKSIDRRSTGQEERIREATR